MSSSPLCRRALPFAVGLCLAGLGLFPHVGVSASQMHFTDVSQEAGIQTTNMFGGVRTKRYILETTGTGAAFFDYDEDGDPDLFLVNGTRLGYSDLQSASNVLYRNDGTEGFRG